MGPVPCQTALITTQTTTHTGATLWLQAVTQPISWISKAFENLAKAGYAVKSVTRRRWSYDGRLLGVTLEPSRSRRRDLALILASDPWPPLARS